MKRLNRITAATVLVVFLLSPFHYALATPVAPIAPESPESAATAPTAPTSVAADQEEPVVPATETEPLPEQPLERTAIFNGVEEATPCGDCPTEQQNLIKNNEAQSPETLGDEPEGDAGAGELKSEEGGNQTVVENENKAEVDNLIGAGASSGNNNADYNTGNGTVDTGDSNLAVTLLNLINTNITALGDGLTYVLKNILGSLVGDYLLPSNSTLTGEQAQIAVGNETTGANSVNNATLNTINGILIDNNNEGSINNNLDLSSSTGGNSASYNTGNGSITTGDSNLSLNVLNFLNSNFIITDGGIIAVINVFGDWLGDLLLPANYKLQTGETVSTQVSVNNFNTGANSVNNATIDSSETITVDNSNTADIENNIEAGANTGDNLAGFNTGNGSVNTGTSTVGVEINNDGNRNIFADLLMYLTVNILGSWTGAIMLPSSANVDTNAVSSIEVGNENTGANSENNANLEMDEEVRVENDNKAKINNNVNILSSTGGNSASYNTGSGEITTGNAKALLNILNIFNQNIFGGRVLYLMVNVFGNWKGNIDIVDEQQQGEPITDGANGKKVVKVSSDDTENITVSEVSGRGFDVQIGNEEEQPKVLAAVVSSEDTGSGPKVSKQVHEQPSFWKQNMGKIFGGLFLVYLILLTIAAYRKKQRKELFKEFV